MASSPSTLGGPLFIPKQTARRDKRTPFPSRFPSNAFVAVTQATRDDVLDVLDVLDDNHRSSRSIQEKGHEESKIGQGDDPHGVDLVGFIRLMRQGPTCTVGTFFRMKAENEQRKQFPSTSRDRADGVD